MGQFLKVEKSKLKDFIQKQGIDLQCLQKELEIEVAKYHMKNLSASVDKVVSEDSGLQQEAERCIRNMEHNLKEIETKAKESWYHQQVFKENKESIVEKVASPEQLSTLEVPRQLVTSKTTSTDNNDGLMSKVLYVAVLWCSGEGNVLNSIIMCLNRDWVNCNVSRPKCHFF